MKIVLATSGHQFYSYHLQVPFKNSKKNLTKLDLKLNKTNLFPYYYQNSNGLASFPD